MLPARHCVTIGVLCSDQVLLNAAVRAYLVSQGYKLTALTMSEESGNSILAALPQKCPTLAELWQSNAQRSAAIAAQEVRLHCHSC